MLPLLGGKLVGMVRDDEKHSFMMYGNLPSGKEEGEDGGYNQIGLKRVRVEHSVYSDSKREIGERYRCYAFPKKVQ